MDPEHLVIMANQIGHYFEPWPDQEAARKEVTNHLTRFWDPRMRRTIIAHLEATGDERSGLMPLVAAAVRHLDKVPA